MTVNLNGLARAIAASGDPFQVLVIAFGGVVAGCERFAGVSLGMSFYSVYLSI